MSFVFITLFVLVSFLLILVILLQPGKGSGMGAIGGGGGGGTVFGARGAVGFLGKMTGWLAAAFMVLALILARMSIDSSGVTPGLKTTPQPLQEVTETGAPPIAGEEVAPTAPTAPVAGDEAKPAEEAAPAAPAAPEGGE